MFIPEYAQEHVARRRKKLFGPKEDEIFVALFIYEINDNKIHLEHPNHVHAILEELKKTRTMNAETRYDELYSR